MTEEMKETSGRNLKIIWIVPAALIDFLMLSNPKCWISKEKFWHLQLCI